MSKLIVFFLLCLIGSIFTAPFEDFFLDEIDEEYDFDTDLYPEYRSFFSLLDWNNESNEDKINLQKRIQSVTKWSIQKLDYSHCHSLPEIRSKLDGDIEKRTIGLKSIPKFELKFRTALNKKYNKLIEEIRFMNSTFPFLRQLLMKKLRSVEELKNKILKEQNEKFLKYQQAIQERIENTLEISLGQKVTDLLFRNSTIILKSNAQIKIVQDSLTTLLKCFNSIKPNIKDKSFIKYAKSILSFMKGYNYNNLITINPKFNVLSDINIRRLISLNAKLTEFDDGLLQFKTHNLFFENSDDEKSTFETISYNKEDDLKIDTNDDLKVAYHFDNFVSSIVSYSDDIKYNQNCKSTKVDLVKNDEQLENQIPHVEGHEIIDKELIMSLTNKAMNIKEKCKLIKDLDNCIDGIVNLGNIYEEILRDKVIFGYNEAIKNLLKVNVGSNINKSKDKNFTVICDIKNLNEESYILSSAAQLNKALELLEFGKMCLMSFGLQSENNFKFHKILPIDDLNQNLEIDTNKTDSCNKDGLILKNNEDKILERLNATRIIKDNSFLYLNFDL